MYKFANIKFIKIALVIEELSTDGLLILTEYLFLDVAIASKLLEINM